MATMFPTVYGATGVIERPMPAENGEKPKRETWQDWWPNEPSDPEHLLTREEVLAQLGQEGFVVSEESLRHWQALGAVPYAVRQWHNGATRALYPQRMLTVLRTLRNLQADGKKMSEVREHLRNSFRHKFIIDAGF